MVTSWHARRAARRCHHAAHAPVLAEPHRRTRDYPCLKAARDDGSTAWSAVISDPARSATSCTRTARGQQI